MRYSMSRSLCYKSLTARLDSVTKRGDKAHYERIHATMTGAYMEPETGDLNAARSNIADIRSMATPVQHSVLFNRRGSAEQVLLCIYHYDDIRQLHLVVFEGDPAFPTITQEIKLSYEEAKLLRDFLNRPEIVAIVNES
jgi:hypothetical protein